MRAGFSEREHTRRMEDELLAGITSRELVAGVMGLGYVGLPLAIEIARAGYRVVGFDVSEQVVAGLNSGASHIRDVDSAVLAPLVSAGLITCTTDMDRLSECDVISVCVPTPLSKTRDPDVSYIIAAGEALGRRLRRGQLVILESTTYPGTTRELLLPKITERGFTVGEDVFLCFSPERVDPGNEVWHVGNTPKVLGGITPRCLELGQKFYSEVIDQVVAVSSPEAAELTKLLENTFRSVNIALVNEMAQVCDLLGVDVFEVIEAAATKPFGFMKFVPGPGIGGHCIPLDPHYLAWKMKALNYKTRMVELASEINSEMPHYVLDKVQDALNDRSKSIRGSRILVLGIAYKRDIDDLRESPALDLLRLLVSKGAEVSYHDPYVPEYREDDRIMHSVELTDDSLRMADCVVIATDHQVFDYHRITSLAQLIVDTRNATRNWPAENVVGLSGAVAGLRKELQPAGTR